MEKLLEIWQTLPHYISPVAFSLGGFEIRWYGLMYIIAFILVYLLTSRRVQNEERYFLYNKEDIFDFMTFCMLGLIVGARIGYVIFYQPEYYFNHPLEIILPFQFENGALHMTGIAGMSYHGGLAGILMIGWFYIRKKQWNFRGLCDLIIPCIPLGYIFGRLGNFINGELYGNKTQFPLGMYFEAGGPVLRHASQLYEAVLEGLVLFIILWVLKKKFGTTWRSGISLPLYLIGYAIARYTVEFLREPDVQLGHIIYGQTMGQLLSIGMVIAGTVIYIAYVTFDRRKSNQ